MFIDKLANTGNPVLAMGAGQSLVVSNETDISAAELTDADTSADKL